MKSDYVPDSYENRYNWLVNLRVQVNDQEGNLNWDAAKLTAFNALVDPLIALYKAVVDAQVALDASSGNAREGWDAASAALRALIAEIKTNPGFTEGMGEAMRIFTSGAAPEPGDIKPAIEAVAHRGGVKISGTKNYAETVNIYMRRAGGAWVLIAPRRKRLPFEDQTPLAAAGVPEEREYMARGVIGDEEVGQDSDIVGTVFGG